MSILRLAGILIIIGFLISTADLFVSPSGVHDAPDDTVRQTVIDANKSRWTAYLWIGALATALIAGGFVLFASRLWSEYNKLLIGLASGAMILVVVFYMLYTIRGVGDTQDFVQNYYAGSLWVAHTAAYSVAGILFGILLRQSGFQPWLAFATIITSAGLLVYAARPSVNTYGIFLIFFIIILVIGIVMVTARNLQVA